MQSETKIAIFDFDGTFVKGDSLLLYLTTAYFYLSVHNTRKFICISLSFPLLLMYTMRHILGQLDAKDYKTKLLTTFLGGLYIAEIERINTHFMRLLSLFVNKSVLSEFLRLKREGYLTVILSASPDIYLRKVKEFFGFDILVSTRAQVINDIITGDIIGENCKGEEKLKRLKEFLFEREIRCALGYADDKSDRWVMEMVGRATWV